ncbi:Uncharacterised protein [Starkeya nomas]|uniref:Uncharacterized protein n=1 Tax=Starkeya nomas TaxID=2666134 RepID=A0A5S9PN84_9HYPH|nr:Uncharacterised protein [Starkeya nomas]
MRDEDLIARRVVGEIDRPFAARREGRHLLAAEIDDMDLVALQGGKEQAVALRIESDAGDGAGQIVDRVDDLVLGAIDHPHGGGLVAAAGDGDVGAVRRLVDGHLAHMRLLALGELGDDLAAGEVDHRERAVAGLRAVEGLGLVVDAEAEDRVVAERDRLLGLQRRRIERVDEGLAGTARAGGGDIDTVHRRAEDELVEPRTRLGRLHIFRIGESRAGEAEHRHRGEGNGAQAQAGPGKGRVVRHDVSPLMNEVGLRCADGPGLPPRISRDRSSWAPRPARRGSARSPLPPSGRHRARRSARGESISPGSRR